jgi:hypothetical protein
MRTECRKSMRRFVRQGATMICADGSGLGTCLMIDISGAGARLKIDASDALPDEFILLLSHNGKLRRGCTVAWRSGNAVGVRFLPARSINQSKSSRMLSIPTRSIARALKARWLGPAVVVMLLADNGRKIP